MVITEAKTPSPPPKTHVFGDDESAEMKRKKFQKISLDSSTVEMDANLTPSLPLPPQCPEDPDSSPSTKVLC